MGVFGIFQGENRTAEFERLADDLAQQGQFADAAAEYQEALRLNLSYVKTKLDLAAVLLNLGRKPEAIPATGWSFDKRSGRSGSTGTSMGDSRQVIQIENGFGSVNLHLDLMGFGFLILHQMHGERVIFELGGDLRRVDVIAMENPNLGGLTIALA